MKYEVQKSNDGWAIVKLSSGEIVEEFDTAFYAHMACAVLND